MKKVTVILPVYNEKKEYLEAAIESMLSQTFSNFYLFITLDNPNNNELKSLIEKYQESDDRIVFFINERNMGLPKTLNKMISEVETEYIARMDADDIADKDRLKIQYEYMINNPTVDLCGTNIIYINDKGNELFSKAILPEKNKWIIKCLKYQDVLVHPSFFCKSVVMKKMLYRNLKYAQDYDFVCRLAEEGYQLANINEYLLYYRIGKNSERKVMEQWIIGKEIRKYYKKNILREIDIENLIFRAISQIRQSDVKRYSQSSKCHERGVGYWKNGEKIKGLFYIWKSLFLSSLQKEDFIRALQYKILMRFAMRGEK